MKNQKTFELNTKHKHFGRVCIEKQQSLKAKIWVIWTAKVMCDLIRAIINASMPLNLDPTWYSVSCSVESWFCSYNQYSQLIVKLILVLQTMLLIWYRTVWCPYCTWHSTIGTISKFDCYNLSFSWIVLTGYDFPPFSI